MPATFLPWARKAKCGCAAPRSCWAIGNGPTKPSCVLTADGWLRTGDIGAFDAEGFLKLLDRKKDMINVSGFKAFPNEVEDIAMQHPGVLEAAVIGVPNARTGQAVKLFVVKRDPALDEAELSQYLRTRLAGYKRPTIIEFVDSLPKSNDRQNSA